MNGVELVNPAFSTIEGRNLLDYKDTRGKYLYRDIIEVVQAHGSGWVNYMWVLSGAMRYSFDDREVELRAGEVLIVPSNVPHSIVVQEETTFVTFFAPRREDWLRGEDQYLR